MRHYDETDESDVKDAEEIRAQPWMLRLLKANPGYCGWGPHEDYMIGKDKGWASAVEVSSWKEFGPWKLDDLNTCAGFYFEVSRESKDCEACDRTGLNPESQKVQDDFYALDLPHGSPAWRMTRWCDRITQDEVQALVDAGRLKDFTHTFIAGRGWVLKSGNPVPSSEEVNAWEAGRGMGHDAINRWILVETRCKRLGVWGHCAACGGSGSIYTSETANLSLILWMLHPRKGASRGVEVKGIQESDVPAIAKWLNEAAAQNAQRFAGVAALVAP